MEFQLDACYSISFSLANQGFIYAEMHLLFTSRYFSELIILVLISFSFCLKVLLSPPIVVYSPRVLPVYIYDAHADSGKNVRYDKVSSFLTSIGH